MTQAAQRLAGQAHRVGYVSGREPWRKVVQWITREGSVSRLAYRAYAHHAVAGYHLGQRIGWRQRAANLDGDFAFAVDYQLCRRCRLGWVEEPYTLPRYQRCGLGLARAGLAALRVEHPGFSWPTLGGHFRDSQSFWAAVGTDVPGSYKKRPLCSHIKANG